jgi:hypothetical protein
VSEGGEHQHPNGGAGVRDDAPRGLDAVEAGHADVHQHDGGRAAAGQFYGLEAVLGLPDDLDLGVCFEQFAEAGAHERLVVADEDADAHPRGTSNGSRALTA